MALQFLANIKMHEINIDGLKKFEVEYDERGNIKVSAQRTHVDVVNMCSLRAYPALSLANVAKKWVSARVWARSAMPMTTLWLKASLQAWNVS